MNNSAAPPSLQGVAVPQLAVTQSAVAPFPDPMRGQADPVELRPTVRGRPPEPKVQFDARQARENLRQAIEQINKELADSGRSLGIRMDDVLNSPVVTVKNAKTGEVIRQIPSEAVIKVAHTFEQLKGLLVDEMS